jgi:hypothetical protein
VAGIFPSRDFPPELHPIDWFIDSQSDKVEGLFKHLFQLLDQAELGPIRMREGVDSSTTPSAMEHLRRIDRELDRLDGNYTKQDYARIILERIKQLASS